MLDNIIVGLMVILIVFSTLVVGIIAIICMYILQCVIKIYTEYVKMRRKE